MLIGANLYRYSCWPVLGAPVLEGNRKESYSDLGFQGKLTKVQIWSRALDVTNEIQKQVRDCRSEPVLYKNLILNWAGYEQTLGGVQRSVPSTCGQKKCKPGYAGPNCQQLQIDREPPTIEYCPSDLWIVAKNGSTVVNWEEPRFNDNIGISKIVERNGHRSGETLLWGIYDVMYLAYDAAGNTASCGFRVTIVAEFCPALADPLGGSQSCKDWGAGGQFKVCEIACNPGMKFSQVVPKFYTCGSEGFWRPTAHPNVPLVYPSCSPTKPAQRLIRIQMQFPSDVLCNEAGQGVLRQRIKNAINALNRDWNLCSYSMEGSRECRNVDIDVRCDRNRHPNIVKRQTVLQISPNPESAYAINATIPIKR